MGEPQPTVSLAAPKMNQDDFDKYNVDGIDVYVVCTAQAKNDTLSIDFKKVLFGGKLVVEGLVF
ncbi:MAG: hypothetical protein Q4Q17_03545 [Tissierellia bacterium]|nr:hypothetical protein [Tissierellia bacterium]